MRKSVLTVFTLSLLSIQLTTPQPANAQIPVYKALRLAPLAGYQYCETNGVNSHGQVVGYSSRYVNNQEEDHACLWQGSQVIDLGTLGGKRSWANAINTFGVIVGASETPETDERGWPVVHAFRWSSGSMEDLGTLGGSGSWASDINEKGEIVGRSQLPSRAWVGCRWLAGAITSLSPLGGNYGIAVNDLSLIVGTLPYWNGSSVTGQAALWNAGAITDLGTLGPYGSSVAGINKAGSVTGSMWSDWDSAHAFLYDKNGLHDLGTLGGPDSHPNAINEAGQIVGSTYLLSGQGAAFIWSNGVMRNINELIDAGSGWDLIRASGISNSGRIIGYGTGDFHRFVGSCMLVPLGTLPTDRAGNTGKFSMQLVYPGMQAGIGTVAKLSMDGQPDIVGQNAVVFEDDNFKTSVLHASFDLTNALPGKWTLVIDPPNADPVTLNNIFTVEEARAPAIGVQVSGRPKVRAGFGTVYQVAVTNSGNFDAVNVPIWFAASDPAAQITAQTPLLSPPPVAEVDVDFPAYFTPAVPTGAGTILPVIIPRVPPGGVVTLDFLVQFPAISDRQVSAWTSPLYRQLLPNMPTDAVKKSLREIVRHVYAAATGETLLELDDTQLNSTADASVVQLHAVRDNAYDNTAILDSPTSLTWLVEQQTLLLAHKKGRTITDAALKSAVSAVFGQLSTIAPSSFSSEAELRHPVVVRDSDDPNWKDGPVSAAPEVAGNWIAGDLAHGFTVHFENKKSSDPNNPTPPAQVVRVVDQIDPVAFDVSTLSLGGIIIPDGTLRPTTGISPVATGEGSTGEYTAQMLVPASATRPHALKVNVRVFHDPATNQLTWELRSLRQDGQPMTEDDGFLAEGQEGSVSYTVFANRTSPTIVTSSSAINYFDTGAGVPTNTWSATIDNVKPTSAVAQLTAKRTNPNIVVNWSGSDVGVSTAVRDYSIYVSTDGGPYLHWQTTNLKSGTFVGEGGHTYQFFSIATDLTGNIELPPALPDTTTTVTPAPYLLPLTPNPVPGSQQVTGTVTINVPAPSGGVDIPLTNTNPAAKFSNGTDAMTITIPAGAMTSPPFIMTTVGVTSDVKGTVKAKYAGVYKATTLTVRPVRIASFTVAASQLTGGQITVATVDLECPAAPAGISVALSSDNSAVAYPAVANLTFSTGVTTKTVNIRTNPVAVKTTVKITATANGFSKTLTVVVKPPVPLSVTLSPTTVRGGVSSTGTVKLNGKAPAGGLVVLLKSNSDKAIVPPSVTVPADLTTAPFPITTLSVTSNTYATITATANLVAKTAKLTITP